MPYQGYPLERRKLTARTGKTSLPYRENPHKKVNVLFVVPSLKNKQAFIGGYCGRLLERSVGNRKSSGICQSDG
jgi:hypothetical protein